MTYDQLTTLLMDDSLSKSQYYTLLTTNARLIVGKVATTNKISVAKGIQMSPQAFSTAFPLLTSLVYPHEGL